ncbi:2-succinyl-5-enolpyruvyl-6-hydroxy-3-cyclohexene-1-carboxylic-acid synthase [Pseudonocardia sp. CA-107938]|uniref:2-succinyl-5-enolpyruvyl-6-hydroxy-3- cyclohexene-1-carboxylic-acid synthase n=1 Tax=Pseudonocardia sp. CA-107938 TaxID=3240021 RepID=UPI003D9176E4
MTGQSTRQARAVVDELVRGGVTDAVLCPGSRNAPLAFALQAADAAGRLRLHVRIDERGAGFLALGLARGSGRPVPVCTTSGTAVANLHPAVLEASHAGVPVIALTADRPAELIGTGASQTVDQTGIFGGAVRLAVTAATDDRRVRAQVCRVLAAAAGPWAGPVHLNVPFTEPLVPDDDVWPAGRPAGQPWTSAPPSAQVAPPLPLDPIAPTLVLAGTGDPAPAYAGLPVVAEPGSAAWPHALRAGPWLLDDQALRPAQVVVAGRPTLHRSVQRLLADPDVAVYALAGAAPWPDVPGTVRAVGALPQMIPDPVWLATWKAADRAAASTLDAALDIGLAPAGMRLARELVAGLPPGSALTIGSSNPVRDIALAARPRSGITVLTNRGVAGIDGTVSTATGFALAGGGPGYALLGDLTLLHDVTGLMTGPDEPRPDLTIVVLNDRGGGIFGLLEQGAPEHAGAFERVFGTPHTVDLAALCAAIGVAHTAVAPADLAGVLEPAPGVRVIEVPADRAMLRSAHGELRKAIGASVAEAVAHGA